MNTFKSYLSSTAPYIQKKVDETLADWSINVKKQTPSLAIINSHFIDCFSGGKYIRGTLVKLGFEMFAIKKNNDVLTVAAAFEILHTSLLIHDDIIDKSQSRRGKLTLHTRFKNSHYGLSQAICFGDIGFFLSTKLLAKTALTSHFSEIVLDTILGEMLDVKLSFEKQKNESEIISMQKLKTAHYTLSGPLLMGARLGNASAKQLSAIKKFGEHLGLAYQIHDDILGIFGDEKITGKSSSNDIEENKNTLLISYALKKANPAQKKLLTTYYGKKPLTPKQQNTIKGIFQDTGSLLHSQNMILHHNQQARLLIPVITSNKKNQTYLHDFIDFLASRTK